MGQMLGVKGLTMTSIEDLKQMLNVDSGAVSLCAMINDPYLMKSFEPQRTIVVCPMLPPPHLF
ncbi:hypothetical protein CRG86_014375 [Photobacterium leiognathi]|nr:hypothetical protein CRG86_014375 [Photobacterium leiognathi]